MQYENRISESFKQDRLGYETSQSVKFALAALEKGASIFMSHSMPKTSYLLPNLRIYVVLFWCSVSFILKVNESCWHLRITNKQSLIWFHESCHRSKSHSNWVREKFLFTNKSGSNKACLFVDVFNFHSGRAVTPDIYLLKIGISQNLHKNCQWANIIFQYHGPLCHRVFIIRALSRVQNWLSSAWNSSWNYYFNQSIQLIMIPFGTSGLQN